MKLAELEYTLLRSIPQARTASSAAKLAGVSPSYVLRKLQALRGRFTLRGVFDYKALGLEEHILTTRFSARLWEESLPYISLKVALQTGMQPESLLLAILVPRGKAGDVADILGVSQDSLRPAVSYRLRLDAAILTEYLNGELVPLLDNLPEVVDSGKAPRLEGIPPRRVDEIDLWLVAELSRDPFAKLSRAGEQVGLKQQVVSYHHVYHVRPLHLYNATIPRLYSNLPGRLLQLKVREGFEEAVAWALSSLPFSFTSIAQPGEGRVELLAYPGAWELSFLRRLSRCRIILDYKILGYTLEKPREYTNPFGKVMSRGEYRLDILYEALYTPEKAERSWRIYEL